LHHGKKGKFMGHVVNTDMTQSMPDGRLRAGDIMLDLKRYLVIGNGKEKRITGKKKDLLQLLIEHKGNVVTQEMMFAALYPGAKSLPEPTIFRVLVCQLRKQYLDKTSDFVRIENIHGTGYELAIRRM